MGWERVFHPSTLRMVIWPEARRARSGMGTVPAQGSTRWVLMRRRHSSFTGHDIDATAIELPATERAR